MSEHEKHGRRHHDRQRARRRGRAARRQGMKGRGPRRNNVVMVRVSGEDLTRIDELVESGNFKSRSEATAFLITEGIKSKQEIFEKMAETISQIQELRAELGEVISEATKPDESTEQEHQPEGK